MKILFVLKVIKLLSYSISRHNVTTFDLGRAAGRHRGQPSLLNTEPAMSTITLHINVILLVAKLHDVQNTTHE